MSSSSQVTVVMIAYGWSDHNRDYFDHFPTVIIENNPLARHQPPKNATLIQNKVNTGFAKAINQGAAAASTDYVLFVNEDCLIQPAQVDALLAAAEQKKWSVISPSLVDETGHRQTQYQQPLPSFSTLFLEWTPLHLLRMSQSSTVTLPGACILIKKDVLKKLSGWDERYWLWWEDSDFSYRLQQAGIAFGIDHSIQVTHVGGETFAPLASSWKRHVFFHSLRIFSHKHFSSWQARLLSAVTRRFDAHHLYPADEAIRSSIVVPNMKKALLAEFLERHTQAWNWSSDELIIVTSARDIDQLQAKYPQVIWVLMDQNRGFADTVNIGLRRARGQWVGTVNDDTILPKDWIAELLQSAGDDVGSLSPIVANKNNVIESAGVDYMARGRACPIKHLPVSVSTADTFNAAAVLLNRNALEQVGLFDERFGSYLEDIDLGLRLTRRGWRNLVVPTVQITHFGHQTSTTMPIKTAWQNVKNWWLVVLKNTSLRTWLIHGPAIILERGRNVSGFLKTVLG